MASLDSDNDDALRLRESETSNQGQGGGEGDGSCNGHDRTASKIEPYGVGPTAKAKKGAARQKKFSRSKQNDKCRKISKRRCIIPEARVIQAYNERAYIYDSENDEDEREYPNKAIMTVAVPLWMQQKIKNKSSNGGDGKSHHGHTRARCYCFDCW